jgi:hypothetical protein
MEEFDVTKTYRELQELSKLIPREEESVEEAIRESIEYYKSIPMYDWGEKQKSNEHDMTEKYGSKYVKELKYYQYEGLQIPKSLICDLHRIHEGKKPFKKKRQKKITNIRSYRKSQKQDWGKFEKKTDLEPKEYSNEYYSNVRAGLINVGRTKKVLQNPTTLLLYLLQHKPWEGKKDKHNTYHNWYLGKKLIVASVSVERMSADLGVHEKTVRNWLNSLHSAGIIRKLKVGKENIYILGEVIGKEEVYYYAGEASWK